MPSERTLKALEGIVDPYPPEYEAILDDPLWGGRHRYFDRDGEPITMRQWSMLFNVQEYQQLAFTEIGIHHVSTVWLGLDHNLFGQVPLIFESMVFSSGTSWSKAIELEGFNLPGFPYHESLDERRYSTEEQALAGHEELCEQVRLMHEALGGTDPRDVGR